MYFKCLKKDINTKLLILDNYVQSIIHTKKQKDIKKLVKNIKIYKY